MGYHKGEVYTGKGKFTLGSLPPSWKGPHIIRKQLVYDNDPIDGTILSDALCGPKFLDAPLPRLAKDLFEQMGNEKMGRIKEFMLDGRAAVRLQGVGSIDGVLIQMDVVVMKKDFCVYDFVYFAPPKTFAKGISDFEGYFNGFQTR
jgi:hypothetical protein